MPRVVLLTGSNLGDRAGLLDRARARIALRIGRITASSALYESEPWGFSAEEPFLNQALTVETELEPIALLNETQTIEQELGRVRQETCDEAGRRVYRSRPIDIDILFYDDRIVSLDRLTIPHPLIAEREFVLRPLREIFPDYIHPIYKKSIREL